MVVPLLVTSRHTMAGLVDLTVLDDADAIVPLDAAPRNGRHPEG